MAIAWIPEWRMACCGETLAAAEYVDRPATVVDRSDADVASCPGI